MDLQEQLKRAHSLANDAVKVIDAGGTPSRLVISEIRHIVGKAYPALDWENYVGWACFRYRGDNQQPYLTICDSDAFGAFKIYRHPQASR